MGVISARKELDMMRRLGIHDPVEEMILEMCADDEEREEQERLMEEVGTPKEVQTISQPEDSPSTECISDEEIKELSKAIAETMVRSFMCKRKYF